MPWIVVKHPIIWAFSTDGHQVQGGVPPLPTAPIFPAGVVHHIPGPHYVFGKWTDQGIVAEGMGECLWQHDWGLGQLHIGWPGAHLGIIPLGSCLKLQLPASTNPERATGGAIHGGSRAPVAAATSVGYILCQSCWDKSGFPFVLPTGHHISSPSTVVVDVKLGDIFAAVFAIAADALATMAGGKFGSRFGGAGSAGASIASALLGAAVRTKALTAIPLFVYSVLQSGAAIPGAGTITNVALREGARQGQLGRQGLASFGLIIGSLACDKLSESVQGGGSSVPAPF